MRKYVLVGCSGRALGMFAKPIQEKFSDQAKLAGMFDPNYKRMEYFNNQLKTPVPMYNSFRKMIKEQKPDTVIVATVDRYHHQYIIAALDKGMNAITEKPMTIDDKKCRAILAAEKRSGKKVMVTFNYRHAPYVTKIKELVREGKVGKILSIHFEWFLDTKHGADYFRRWHRRKENSGGLLVHKSTHHFDLVNWFLEEEPETVFAFGDRRFYGPTRKQRGKRCLTCKYKKKCEFYWDITGGGIFGQSSEFLKGFYLDAEKVDKYYRDKCVFSPEIDIEDTMSVNVRYTGGAFLSYSLVAHAPYEGWRMSINGTGGRIEAEEYHSGNRVSDPFDHIRYFDRKGNSMTYKIAKAGGGHGGGDERLLRMLFVGDLPDPLGLMADSRAGAISILTGVAANKSMTTGRPVKIASLLPKAF
ncbi:Gfo/Idh/MocA family oxidoreductase [bacterium]|nr:Gfo/Idh/MocA family oxidoreductase [bacterium]